MKRRAAKPGSPQLAAREAPRPPAPVRQRQRLIDATITALHLYGPSGTTVARVVAVARLSPGIVRFYFHSKAAMLVAALQFLATEFEERVMNPVAALRAQPALALERLVDLYLDPDIASPRKVAVWYAFWGEASARQEYLAICGQKDANFAALVRDLVDRMIVASGRSHLDGDAVALGLIGVLEMLWQGFAFEEESSIDRAAARGRCMSYLRSVFPRDFAAADDAGPASAARGAARPDPALDPRVREAWQFVGHESEAPRAGSYLALELTGTRVLVLRDVQGSLRAFRNACPARPHALAPSRSGVFESGVACALHGLAYELDGRARPPAGPGGLAELPLHCHEGWLFVRTTTGPMAAGFTGAFDGGQGRVTAIELQTHAVAAHWTHVVAGWLESRMPEAARDAWGATWQSPVIDVDEPQGRVRWAAVDPAWRREYLWPNLLVERRPDGLTLLQVQPAGADRSRVQVFEYVYAGAGSQRLADGEAARRQLRELLERELAVAASVQQGGADPGYEADSAAVPGAAVAAFRRMLHDAES